ncbi:MAG TPA: tRNA pseudouridine(55) synthase TruB [Candidatus Pullichristensenella stercoripullorum]|nr:tRNA pseudouridine(55) synthase TruB [Candidatus Pullichristensenella stercoripullorum]
MDGFLVLNKPLGKTSSDCVVFVRKRLPRGTAIGHGGTLDPMASGVLPVCVGAATRLFDYIIDKQKTYVAELQLGVVTDTQDATGAVVETRSVNVTEADVRAALPRFIGEIWQRPPMYSAIKRGGKRLYELARRGESVEVAPRACRVDDVRLTASLGDGRYRLEVDCGKGVYIRTLCHDIGAYLGCGGHMATLERTRAGVFTLENALTLEEVDALGADGLEARLLPMDAAIAHLSAVRVEARHRAAVRNGMPLRPEWLDAPAPQVEAVRVYVGGEFAGIGAPREDGSVRFRAMLLK